jgi:hypothetical protein
MKNIFFTFLAVLLFSSICFAGDRESLYIVRHGNLTTVVDGDGYDIKSYNISPGSIWAGYGGYIIETPVGTTVYDSYGNETEFISKSNMYRHDLIEEAYERLGYRPTQQSCGILGRFFGR